ncbi:MAG: VWA domain-containing protein, partial [Clostridiales bacterium]
MENYIEHSIVSFVHILRGAGMIISTSELLDALEALKSVNITDRRQVYLTLRAVLVKSEMDSTTFSVAFDSFFVVLEDKEEQMGEYKERKDEVDSLKEELVFKENPIELSKEDLDVYANMPEASRERIKKFAEMTNEGYNVSERHRNWLERSIRGALDFQRSQMDSGDIVPIETTGQDDWDAILYNMAKNKDAKELIFKNMVDIKDDEIKDTVVLIRHLARRMATRIGRRYRRSSKREAVDVRQSIRSNLRYGGVMLDLKYRRKRLQKPSIVLLADASGSMLKYSRFVIQLMLGLSEALPNMRGFAFADYLTKLELKDFHPEDFGKIEGIGDGTNLNASLLEFSAKYDKLLN